MSFANGDVRMCLGCAESNERVLSVGAVRFDEQNRMRFREAGEELLRTLPDPVPAQMTQRNNRRVIRLRGVDPRGGSVLAKRSAPLTTWDALQLVATNEWIER